VTHPLNHYNGLRVSRDDDEVSALSEFVRRRDREKVNALLSAGAHRSRLTSERQTALSALLAMPTEARETSPPTEGCIPGGD